MKLLRTIRLDPSDTFVFERAAEPGEWAVSGAFLFAEADPDALPASGAPLSAADFWACRSLGWSTLVQIVEAATTDRAALVDTLAQQLLAGSARPISRPRAPPPRRRSRSRPRSAIIRPTRWSRCAASFEDGAIREAFRTLHPRGERKPMRAFTFLDVDGEEEPGETVDLARLATAAKPREP